MKAIQKCNFTEFEPLCQKLWVFMSNLPKTTHQIWSCHVILASTSENFYFSTNSVSNFREHYQIWGKFAQEQKVTGKKQIGNRLFIYAM